MEKFKLVDAKFIDKYHFQIIEGKFIDLEQTKNNNEEIYVYANISNFGGNIEDSDVRYYSHSFASLCGASRYELYGFNSYDDDVKAELLDTYICKEKFSNSKGEYKNRLCGLVWCKGNKDFEVWETDSISHEDQVKIEEILAKYDTSGTSINNVWGMEFSDLFSEEY